MVHSLRVKAFLSLLLVVAVPIQPLQAATFNVINTHDAGAGSLRQAVLDSNGAGGANTISWGGGSGGTITLGSDLAAAAANTTFDLSGATVPAVVAGAPFAVPLAGAATFNNDSAARAAMFSAVISGAGGFTKTGQGTINLTGVNTYAGGTTFNAGILGVNADAALGNAAGNLTFNGGTLQTTSGFTTNRGITLTGNGTLDNGGNVSTFSGAITGAGALTAAGSSTTFLTGANNYTGGTILNAGILNAKADAALGNAAGALTFNGGTLQLGTAFSTARAATINAAGGTLDTNGFNSTESGIIGGAGVLTKAGLGALTLTGVNTYLGGTSIAMGTVNVGADAALGAAAGAVFFTSGTLQLGADLATARAIYSNGTLAVFDNNGHNLTLSGAVAGGGPVTFSGAGNVTLTGSNSYSGGTAINGGNFIASGNTPFGYGAINFNGASTVQLSASSGVYIANPMAFNVGAVFDVNGGTATFAGALSGAAGLTKNSQGVLNLTGPNSYAGNTLVNGGVLGVAGDYSLGAVGSNLTLNNGASLQALSDMSTARTITLAGTGGTFDALGDITAAGLITGAGGLTKIGLGQLLLTHANNNYGGATSVAAGTLALGVNGALPAGTALTVAGGATFALGAYTQTVNTYTQPGTLAVTLQNAQRNAISPSLTVTGAANVTNGTLVVSLLPQAIRPGDTFTPLTSGALAGLPTVRSPALISFTPSNVGNNLQLTAVLVPFANVAGGGNRTALGNTLEPFRAGMAGDMGVVLSNLYTLTADQLHEALDEMGPGSFSSMKGIGMAGSSAQASAVGRRMAALADGSDQTPQATHFTVNKPSPYPGTLYAAAPGDVEPSEDRRAGQSPWGFFTSGLVNAGRLNEGTNAGGTTPGYAFNTGGLTAGADYRLNDNSAVGAYGGYLHGHASLYTAAGGTVDSDSARLGVYGTYFDGPFEADLSMGGAFDTYTTRRNVAFANIARTATGAPRGTEFDLRPSAHYDFETREWGTFTPFAGLSYDRMMINSFSESGAGALNLNVGGQTAESLQSTLGLKFSQKIDMETFAWVPYCSLGWRREFEDQGRPITASFATAGGASFSINGGDVARNGALVGGGTSLLWTKTTTFKLDWTTDFRSHYQNTNVELSARFRF